jgi:hypothetical protein
LIIDRKNEDGDVEIAPRNFQTTGVKKGGIDSVLFSVAPYAFQNGKKNETVQSVSYFQIIIVGALHRSNELRIEKSLPCRALDVSVFNLFVLFF